MIREICVIAFLSGFSAFSFAQVKPLLPDSIVGYYFNGRDSVVDSRRVYTYDQHGWLVQMDSYDRAVPWTFQESWSHDVYTYDPAGTLKTDYFRNGKSWLLYVRSHYYYPPDPRWTCRSSNPEPICW